MARTVAGEIKKDNIVLFWIGIVIELLASLIVIVPANIVGRFSGDLLGFIIAPG